MLPARTADTMSDAIALDSPNGRMSKRAKDAASRRLAVALFGEELVSDPAAMRDYLKGIVPKTDAEKLADEIVSLERTLADWEMLAARGVKLPGIRKGRAKVEARLAELRSMS